MRYLFIIMSLSVACSAFCQQSVLMLKYRQMALDYNHDIKSARENISASLELVGAAKADLKPKLQGGASYQYTGNPMELNIDIPAAGSPVHFQGQHNSYGLSAALSQPVYSGGRLLAMLRKAEFQHDYARNQELLLKNGVSQQSDVTYWSSVAHGEMVSVAEDSKKAVEKLVKLVRQRVELGYTDVNDLLMAEVKLNEAEYTLQQSKTLLATSVMSLNSLIGAPLCNETELDKEVTAITSSDRIYQLAQNVRPEQVMAQNQLAISESDKKINRAKYLPQLHVGAEGYYQSPSYDFTSQMKLNYGVYVKLSVPIFEWNKRGKEARAAQNRVNIANENLKKVDDKINLEVSTARVSFIQAVEQVNLTHNSLAKAFENERRSMERYAEGKLSVMDVLQVQLYRQSAQINYIQAKLAAQCWWGSLQYALNLYNN